jgi:ureidoglycolate lyase
MKLLRLENKGVEKPDILDKKGITRDLSGVVSDIYGDLLSDAALAKIAAIDLSLLPKVVADARIGPCVAKVGEFVCMGLNYSDRSKESGMANPTEPVLFMKATSALTGPNDNVEISLGSEKTDWEVELGLVMGKEAKYVAQEDAMEHIAGYCVINDLSERHFSWNVKVSG